jgi:hypothetical protein
MPEIKLVDTLTSVQLSLYNVDRQLSPRVKPPSPLDQCESFDKMFINVCKTISTVLINRLSDQRLSCRCSRLDDTLKGNRVPV